MEKLEFYSRRDFSERLDFVFDFIKQNYQALLKGSIPIAVSLLLVNVIAGFSITQIAQSSIPVQPASHSLFNLVQNLLILFYILYIFTYIKEYINEEGLPKQEGLWNRSFAYFAKFFTTSLLIGLIVVIALVPILVVALINGLAAALFSGSIGGIVSIAGSLLLLIFLISIPLFWFFIVICLYGPVILTDNISGMAALKESMRLVKNNWWRAFGFLLVCILISAVIVLVLSIPTYIFTIFAVEGSTLISIILSVFSVLGTVFYTIISSVATYVLYGDFKEEKDGIGMTNKIETIGGNRF